MNRNSEESSVKPSFKKYVDHKIKRSKVNLWEMAMGYSRAVIDFYINQPMANMLSLIPSHNNRARALNWFTTEGLLEASMGREKLLELVNHQLGGQNESTKLSEVKADASWNTYGPEATTAGPVNAEDLFSPEARQRRPDLQNVKIDGLSIDEYYEEHFEPKYMSIEQRPGEHIRLNLKKMRQKLTSLGLEPFQYGGPNGYIQFTEKGDYLPDEEKRQYMNSNGQQGVDLRPARQETKSTGAGEIADDVMGEDERGNPVINFMGGSSSADQERANDAIDHMRIAFHNIMYQMEKKKNTGLSQEEESVIHDLLTTKKVIEKAEIGLNDEGAGKEGFARKSGLPDTARGPVLIPVSPSMDLDMVDKLVQMGLDQEFKKQVKSFINPKVFGPEWDGTGPKPTDGYYRVQGDSIIYKLPKAVQTQIYDEIMKPLSGKPPMLGARFELGRFFPANSIKKNTKIILSGLYNAGARSQPELIDKAKLYVHKLNGVNHKDFIQEHIMAKKEIQTIKEKNNKGQPILVPSPSDPIISDLKSKGYKWQLFNKDERDAGVPNWLKYGKGILFRKGSRFKIELDDNDGKYYLHVPSDAEGKPIEPAARGALGHAMLAGNVRMSGGLMGNHINFNPASRSHSTALISALMKGHFGEPTGEYGAHANETELPSVVKACQRARRYFDNKNNDTSSQYWPGEYDLITYGLEGLKSFTGDPAFQIGYITDAELETFLKKNADEEIAKELEAEREKEDWGDISDLSGGRGIGALLHKAGKTTEESRKAIIDKMMSQIKNRVPLFDLGEWGKEVERAFGKNAYQARVKHITNYVFGRMNQEAKSVNGPKGSPKTKAFSALTGQTKDGKETSIDPSSTGFRNSGEDDDVVDRKFVTGKDIMAQHNIAKPDDYVPSAPKLSKRTAGAAQPVTRPVVQQPIPSRAAPVKPQPIVTQPPSMRTAGAAQPVMKPSFANAFDDDDDDNGSKFGNAFENTSVFGDVFDSLFVDAFDNERKHGKI